MPRGTEHPPRRKLQGITADELPTLDDATVAALKKDFARDLKNQGFLSDSDFNQVIDQIQNARKGNPATSTVPTEGPNQGK